MFASWLRGRGSQGTGHFLQVMYYFYLSSKHGGPASSAEEQLDRARILLSRATRGVTKNEQVSLGGPQPNGRRKAAAARLAGAVGGSSSRPREGGAGPGACMGGFQPGGQLGVLPAFQGRVPPPGGQGGVPLEGQGV